MVKQILEDYIQFIKVFDNLIRKEKNIGENQSILNVKGISFQRYGEIGGYIYQFHGFGCRLEKDNIVCEYDYNVKNITFSLWKFKQFITTHPKYKNENFSDKYLELELYKLIEKGELFWMIDGGIVWKIYQYNL